MVIKKITGAEYYTLFKDPYITFNSVAFNELNRYKCEELIFICFDFGKDKLGFIGGIKESKIFSPFSAPVGGFSSTNYRIGLKHIDDAIKGMEEFLISDGISFIKFINAPSFYNPNFLSSLNYCFFSNNYTLTSDINYHINLTNYPEANENLIDKEALRKVRQALSYNLDFVKVVEYEDKATAFNIIKQNRIHKGRPLHLDFDQLLNTSEIINIDFFLAYYKTIPIASAIVYHVTNEIIQVVFWGDNREYSAYRPMNFISYKLFEFYYKSRKTIMDLGISSENGVPDFGLSDFKRNIGGTTEIRYSFDKWLIN